MPAILIDPKGDLGNLMLTFPTLKGGEFLPWINPDEARQKELTPEEYADKQAALWSKGLADWGQGGDRLKRLRPDPWDTVESRYQVGQAVEGTVTNVVQFGAFVRIEDGLEGLVHISELTNGSAQLSSLLRVGDTVRVRITNIDGGRHRIGLALHE